MADNKREQVYYDNCSTNYLYSVLDGLTQEYLPTFECRNDRVAFRNFQMSLQNMSKDYKNSDEFRLYRVGIVYRQDNFIRLNCYDVCPLVANGDNFVGETPKEMDQ